MCMMFCCCTLSSHHFLKHLSFCSSHFIPFASFVVFFLHIFFVRFYKMHHYLVICSSTASASTPTETETAAKEMNVFTKMTYSKNSMKQKKKKKKIATVLTCLSNDVPVKTALCSFSHSM